MLPDTPSVDPSLLKTRVSCIFSGGLSSRQGSLDGELIQISFSNATILLPIHSFVET